MALACLLKRSGSVVNSLRMVQGRRWALGWGMAVSDRMDGWSGVVSAMVSGVR